MEKNKITIWRVFFSLASLLCFQPTGAQPKSSAAGALTQGSTTLAPATKAKEQVLDFEGEVIEGERRRPDLFLQMSIEQVKFDSLIFQRDDFNDYLEVDRQSRSRYLRYK
jgi:hypothetical protein